MPMMSSAQRRASGAAVALAALALLGCGLARKHRVYEPDGADVGLARFTRVGEWRLVADATFSGALRRGARLYSTYDRTIPHGKKPCPT